MFTVASLCTTASTVVGITFVGGCEPPISSEPLSGCEPPGGLVVDGFVSSTFCFAITCTWPVRVFEKVGNCFVCIYGPCCSWGWVLFLSLSSY